MLNFDLRHAVERARRLVQNEDGRVFEEDARDGHALLLSAGEHRAALADIGVEAVRHGHDIIVNLRALRRFDDLLVRRVGAAIADILAHRVGKEEHILLHDADGAVKRRLRKRAHIFPVDADRALAHLVKARDELAERRLASAGGTDDGEHLARPYVHAHVVEHAFILLALVRKAHMVDVDLAAAVFKLLRVRCVLERGLDAHERREALKTCKATSKNLREIRELSHGVDERCDVKGKRDEVNVVHLATHDEIAAHRDDGGGEQRHKKLHRRVEHTHLVVEFALGDLEFLVRRVEFVDLLFLVGKGARRADAGERRLDADIDGGSLLLLAARGCRHLAAARHDDRDEHRQDARHDQRKPPLDGKQDGKRADDRQRRNEQVLGAVVGELRDLKEIARQPAHELARAVVVKEADVQLLHVREKVAADVRLHQNAECVSPVGNDIV